MLLPYMAFRAPVGVLTVPVRWRGQEPGHSNSAYSKCQSRGGTLLNDQDRAPRDWHFLG